MPALLSISEAAKFLGVAPVTLRLWERQGKITSVRTAGGQRRYSLEYLREYKLIEAPISAVYGPEPITYAPNYNLPLSHAQYVVLAGVLAILIILISALALKAGFGGQIKSLAGNIASKLGYTPSDSPPNLGGDASGGIGSVLASQTTLSDLLFSVNVNGKFAKDLEVIGKLTAPNILYSVKAGSGVVITGDKQNPTISASGSASFASIKTGSTTLTATGSGDLLTFAGGTAITISGNTSTNTLTISANSSDLNVSGWTDDGSVVRLTAAGDLVNIGSATGSAKLSLDSGTGIDLFTASQSGNLLAKLDTYGLLNLAATGFTAGLKLQGNTTLFSGVGAPSNANGANGDYYFRTDGSGNTSLYTKVTGTWTPAGGGSTTLQDAYNNGNTITQLGTGVMYANANVVSSIGNGSNGQVLTMNSGTPIWVGATGSGSAGWIQRNNGALSPTNITDDLLIGATATSSARLILAGTPSGAGALDIALTSNAKIKTTYFQLTNRSATGYLLTSDSVGNASWTDSSATGSFGAWTLTGNTIYPNQTVYDLLLGSTSTTDDIGKFTISGFKAGKALAVFNATNADQDILAASSSGVNRFTLTNDGSATQSAVVSAGTAYTLNANSLTTGKGLFLSSTSTVLTSGSLFSGYWNPGSSTTATGNIFNFNVGANALISGNIFSVQDNASDLFSVNQAQITANLPTQFTGVGDVSMAYDLQFTNPIASNINSIAPLYLQAGENFNSSDLTLGTFNKGNVIINSEAFVTNYAATVSSQLAVGTNSPANIGGFYLTNSATFGKALAILNQTESNDILTASSSGTTKFTLSSAGQITVPVGSVSVPSYSFLGDTNTGIYNPSVGQQISFAIAGVQVFRVFQSSIQIPSTGDFSWQVSTMGSGKDLILSRQAAGVLQVGTTALNALGTIDASAMGLGTTSLLSTLDVRGNSGTTPVASISGQTSFAAMVVDNKGVGDLFTASSSGLPRFVITQNGKVGIGTTAPTEKLELAGSNSYFKLSVSDTSLPGGILFADTTASLYPDFGLIFDHRTSLTNYTDGTALEFYSHNPTTGTYNWPLLFKMDRTTDDSVVEFNKYAVGKATVILSAITASGVSGINIINTGAGDYLDIGSGKVRITSTGNVGIGTTGPLATLDVRGNSGTTPVASISGQTSFAAMVVDNKGVGDLFTASSSGLPRFVITQNGRVGIGTAIPADTLDVNGNIKMSVNNRLYWGTTSYGIDGNSSPGLVRILTSGIGRLLVDNNGNVGINTASPLSTLDVRGVSGTTPVASFSGQTSFAAMVVDNSGVGDLFTASSSGLPRFVITQNGRVGIGTAIPLSQLHLNGIGSTNGITFSTTLALYAPSNASLRTTASLTVDSDVAVNGANLTTTQTTFNLLTTNATTINFGDAANSILLAGGSASTGCTVDGTTGNLTCSGSITTTATSGVAAWWQRNGTTLAPATLADSVGIGVTTALAALDVRGNSGTTPVASISGQTSFAAMVVDNKGVGDLFTASSSGLPRFVITQNGNIGIGTALPTATLSLVPTAVQTQILLNPGTAVYDASTTLIDIQRGGTSVLKLDNLRTLTVAGGTFHVVSAGTGGGTGFDVAVAAGTPILEIANASSNPWNARINQANTVRTALVVKGILNPTVDLQQWQDSTGRVAGLISTIGTTPTASFSGQTTYAALVTNNDGVGPLFSASQSGWTRFIIAGDGSITQNANTTTGTAYTMNLNSLSTGTGLFSTSTSNALSTGKLLSLDWSPTTPATASGNLFNINVGSLADISGSYFNIADNLTSLFSVSDAAVTTSLPAAFNAAGDVSMAYDLNFTNQTASYIKSNAPLYIVAGESFENNDLTLQTYGTGAVNIPQSVATTGSPTALRVTGGAHTALTASTEAVDVNFNLARTVQFSTGALTTQRAFLIQAPTYGFVGASTLTNAATLAITGAPIAGTNATITNSAALVVQSGKTGLGTASPLATLHVSDSQTATASAYITNTNTAAGITGLGIKLSSTTLNTTSRFINFLDTSGIIIGKINAANTTTVAYSTNGVDLAEYFSKDNVAIDTGNVVSLSNNDVVSTNVAYDPKMLGIVSNTAGFVGGLEGTNKVLVALVGQVPVKIAASSPAIHKGDFVTSSIVAGRATRAVKPGFVIGKALEDWNPGGADRINIYINNIWADPTEQISSIQDLTSSLQIIDAQVASLSAQLASLSITPLNPPLTLSGGDWQVATESGKLTTALSVQVPELNVLGKLTIGLLTIDDLEASLSSLTGTVTVTGDLAVTGSIKVLGQSAGRDIIPAGSTAITIINGGVSTKSAVFATPEKIPVAVSTESSQSGKFVIKIPAVLPNDLKVNWWIVN